MTMGKIRRWFKNLWIYEKIWDWYYFRKLEREDAVEWRNVADDLDEICEETGIDRKSNDYIREKYLSEHGYPIDENMLKFWAE